MNKRTLLTGIAAVVLTVYLAVALTWASREASAAVCRDAVRIEIIDSVGRGFVTGGEIARELGDLAEGVRGMRLSAVDLDSVAQHLNSIDKIEHATVSRLADNTIRVRVTPMNPVARVWDGSRSYYINRAGKRIGADARYHVDVPLIVGRFGDGAVRQPVDLLPLLDYIAADSTWNSMITMVKAEGRDVFLLPMVRGHVINFGSPDRIADKFARLRAIYTEVMPVKGWNYYDTISVKWDGQVVATRRHNKLPATTVSITDELDEQGDDAGTMSTAPEDL